MFNFYQYKITQYNRLNVKLSNSKLNKIKSAIKKWKWGSFETKNNFSHELLLNIRQVANLWKTFANNSLNDIKLSKTQLSKMIQSGKFLGRLFGPLLKAGLLLIKNVIKPLAKSVLIPLGLTAAASAGDAGIYNKT